MNLGIKLHFLKANSNLNRLKILYGRLLLCYKAFLPTYNIPYKCQKYNPLKATTTHIHKKFTYYYMIS